LTQRVDRYLNKEERFQEWTQLYSAAIYSYFQCSLRMSVADAEELAHHTFVTVWESMDTFKGYSSPRSWIFGIARNLGLRFLRNKRGQKFHSVAELDEEASLNDASHSPENLLIEKRNYELLEQIIEGLSTKKRELFKLRYVHEFSVDELTTLFQEPRETIRSRLRSAREEVKVTWLTKTKNH